MAGFTGGFWANEVGVILVLFILIVVIAVLDHSVWPLVESKISRIRK